MKPKDIEKKLKELEDMTLKVATENFELSQKVSDMDDQLEKIWKTLQEQALLLKKE